MAEIIPAEKLEVGDVFHDSRTELKGVIGVRQMTTTVTYTVIEYYIVKGGLFGCIHYREGSQVVRVEPVTWGDTQQMMANLQPGDHLTLFSRSDGGFYA